MTKIYPINTKEYPLLSKEEEIELLKTFKTAKNGIEKQNSLDELVYHNIGLIYQIIGKVCSKYMPEMLSYGVDGLITAINKYDVNSGARLATYAYNWILKKVYEGYKETNIVTYPDYIWDGISKYKKAYKKYVEENAQEPSNFSSLDDKKGRVSEMEYILTTSSETPMTASMYKTIITAMKNMQVFSLENTMSSDEDGEELPLINLIEDKSLKEKNRRQEIKWAFEDELVKIKRNFGKKGDSIVQIIEYKLEGYNSSEIQKKMNISRSTERTLEQKGMDFLRNSANLRDLVCTCL